MMCAAAEQHWELYTRKASTPLRRPLAQIPASQVLEVRHESWLVSWRIRSTNLAGPLYGSQLHLKTCPSVLTETRSCSPGNSWVSGSLCMPQSSYRRFAVLSRGKASLAELACLLQTATKDDASCSRSSSLSWEPATRHSRSPLSYIYHRPH